MLAFVIASLAALAGRYFVWVVDDQELTGLRNSWAAISLGVPMLVGVLVGVAFRNVRIGLYLGIGSSAGLAGAVGDFIGILVLEKQPVGFGELAEFFTPARDVNFVYAMGILVSSLVVSNAAVVAGGFLGDFIESINRQDNSSLHSWWLGTTDKIAKYFVALASGVFTTVVTAWISIAVAAVTGSENTLPQSLRVEQSTENEVSPTNADEESPQGLPASADSYSLPPPTGI